MKIEYSGPSPVISERGISFKDGKADKYNYLRIAIQILNAISHEYDGHKIYTYDVNERRINGEEMLAAILKFHPDVEEVMNEEIKSFLQYLEEEKDEVNNRASLNKDEKEVYINNLNIMKDYRVQRMTNKFFYKHVVETIKEQIVLNKIKELNTPFYENFWHVLQSIQGELAGAKSSINTKLETLEKNNVLTVKLLISNNF